VQRVNPEETQHHSFVLLRIRRKLSLYSLSTPKQVGLGPERAFLLIASCTGLSRNEDKAAIRY
jgi:hypothetical protein